MSKAIQMLPRMKFVITYFRMIHVTRYTRSPIMNRANIAPETLSDFFCRKMILAYGNSANNHVTMEIHPKMKSMYWFALATHC